MSAVLIASITQLCAADHHHDRAHIAHWTSNKSAEGLRAMMQDGQRILFVAEQDGVIAAVGAIAGDSIALNYVAPTHRFRGISRALLTALEAALHARGHRTIRVMSSTTAHRFYQAQGWQDVGPAGVDRGAIGLPMSKTLAP